MELLQLVWDKNMTNEIEAHNNRFLMNLFKL